MIIFFSMEGCGFCKKAEAELRDELASGRIIQKAHTEAPKGTNGFPTFVNTETDVVVTGYKPKAALLKALGAEAEGYEHHNAAPQPSCCPCPGVGPVVHGHPGPVSRAEHYADTGGWPPASFGYATLGNYWH